MDFKKPIDITAVLQAVTAHMDVLKSVDHLAAEELLQHCTPVPGVQDSLTLGKVEGGTISSKYDGVFLGDKSQGTIVPRKLMVYPIKMEMADEPERYRRSYIAAVPGELRQDHPFEVWIVQHGLDLASEDLLNVLFIAAYDSAADKKEIKYAFDSWGSIVEADRTAKLVSADNGNQVVTDAFNRANIGTVLLGMWRSRPETFKRKNSKMFLSGSLADLYDDWFDDEHTHIVGVSGESAGQKYLYGTNQKCEIVRVSSLPEGSQFVLLTTQANMVYGFDKTSDMKKLMPFASGNPYLYTAAGKYVFGCQFISIHKSEFCVNDKPVTPVA